MPLLDFSTLWGAFIASIFCSLQSLGFCGAFGVGVPKNAITFNTNENIFLDFLSILVAFQCFNINGNFYI